MVFLGLRWYVSRATPLNGLMVLRDSDIRKSQEATEDGILSHLTYLKKKTMMR